MSITIGVDLGTTNSAVAYHDGKTAQIIESESGKLLMPSVVSVRSDGSFVVGYQAEREIRRDMNPKYVFSNIKRHIGQPYRDGEDYGEQIENVDGQRWFIGPNDMLYSPQELSAEILKSLKAIAERKLGKKVTGAVVAVPAYFNEKRVDATREAAELAGFNPKKISIWREPSLAAYAYKLDQDKFANVAVFDMGGGTFDIVLMTAGGGLIEPKAINGKDSLGGADFDDALMRHVMEQYRKEKCVDLRDGSFAEIKLRPAAEDAKKELSEHPEAEVAAQNVHYDTTTGESFDVRMPVSQETVDALTQHFVDEAMAITRRTLEQANMKPTDFKEVLLVGGMTRMPAVRKAVAELFGEKRLRDTLNPDWAVALGAAIVAAKEDGRLKQGARMEQITAMAFGIETTGGRFHPVLPKGTPYGQIETAFLTTSQDDQDIIPIDILQGDAPDAVDCTVVRRYEHRVKGGAKSDPALKLEMMVDSDGSVMASGEDLDTGEKFSIGG